MALMTGNNAPVRARGDQEPYYKRLEPIDGGYELTHANGRANGRIRVFDDRRDGDAIHVQFGQGGGGKMAVMHFDDLAAYDELIEALTTARATL